MCILVTFNSHQKPKTKNLYFSLFVDLINFAQRISCPNMSCLLFRIKKKTTFHVHDCSFSCSLFACLTQKGAWIKHFSHHLLPVKGIVSHEIVELYYIWAFKFGCTRKNTQNNIYIHKSYVYLCDDELDDISTMNLHNHHIFLKWLLFVCSKFDTKR